MLPFEPNHPKRAPHWRWEFARWLRDGGGKKRRKNLGIDDLVKIVRKYQDEKAKSKDYYEQQSLAAHYPGLFWAEYIYNDEESDTRWLIEAMLLARADIKQIAYKCNISDETVFWYEAAFFNVTPYLDREYYIYNVVFGQAFSKGVKTREYDLLWKAAGYAMGPIALDFFVKPFFGGPWITDPKRAGTAMHEAMKMQLLRKAAIGVNTIPVPFNEMNLISTYAAICELEKAGAGGAGNTFNTLVENLHASFTNLKDVFMPGHAGSVATPELSQYHETGVEMRASEMLAVSLGQHDQVKGLAALKRPDIQSDEQPAS